MSLSTLRKKLARHYLRIEKVRYSDPPLYRLKNINFNVYVGGYDCYYDFDGLVKIVADDDSDE